MKLSSSKLIAPISMLLTIGASAENALLVEKFCDPSLNYILSLAQNSYVIHEAVPEPDFDYTQPNPKKSYKMKAKIIEKRKGTSPNYE